MTTDPIAAAIDHIRSITPADNPWTADDVSSFSPWEPDESDYAIATILNAVVSGQLINRASRDEMLAQVRRGEGFSTAEAAARWIADSDAGVYDADSAHGESKTGYWVPRRVAQDEIARLTAEVERLTKGSICEVAATNPSVMEYMRHWEGRAEKAEAERDLLWMRADNHWETLRSIRYIAQTSGDLGRIIQWVDDSGSGYTETAEATLAQVMDERDQALAWLAAAHREAIERCAALLIELGYVSESGETLANEVRGLRLDPRVEAALNKLLAEARLEGWRAGRDNAAEVAVSRYEAWSDEAWSDSDGCPVVCDVTACADVAAAIRALPEPKEASHE